MYAESNGRRIGFVSTRFSGTDGVTLESAKWARLLWDYRHISHWYAGRMDRSPDVSMLVPHAYFGHADIQWINERIYGQLTRDAQVTTRIYAISDHLKQTLYEFTRKFDIEILIAENALCIPMNVPLGIALTNFIAETGFPTIAHHHDFYWERDRFSVNGIGDILRMAFPCTLPSVQHVTINSAAQRALSHRRGCSSVLVPNVLDFETDPPQIDDYNADFRESIGLEPEDIIFLQPTRVVPRKGIEHSISLIGALDNPHCKLIVSHESGDEGNEYLHVLQEMAEDRGVDLRLISERIDEVRGTDTAGKKLPELARGLGLGLKEFKKASKDIKDEVESATKEVEKSTEDSK